MNVLAAIDLRGGAAVQLVGGRTEQERVRDPDVRGLAHRWSRSFAGIHVVDLDAALGEGGNAEAIGAVLDEATVPVQVGGGLRDEAAVARVLEAGARRAIVGTRGVDEPDWLERVAVRWPGRVVLAADVRGGRVLRRGWTESTALSAETLLERVADAPLAGVLVTDVSREGALAGVDVRLFAHLAGRSALPVIVAGGIASIDDLRALRDVGARAAVLGMSLYTGAIDPEAVAREFERSDLLEDDDTRS